ncbi:fumarylacetoacetate hydrolase family protein [Thalassotalea marina]|uniref:2-keto-4-pentenoate hydratase n=1 Tax=Thalassotalea marina TaxID=1673741 RepID=A0A919B9P1_9GAMM|nr:fumarylacetoacetate hydrolase family protein [Thalassotalea marina]GHF77109.1 2-keto-4-pentenoate hydratase [Thalassotalea marina]
MNTVVVDNEKVIPNKIVCIGRNYVEHIQELNNEVPSEIVVFNKPNSAIGERLISFHQEPIHYEAELCFLIRNGKYHAVGLGLDLTKRDLQSKLKLKGLPWERAKAFDNSALFTKFIVLDELEVNALSFQLLIDDRVTQEANIELMMSQPNVIRDFLASYTQLQDNDIVMTGTPKGVGVVNSGSEFVLKLFSKNLLLLEQSWQAE